LWWLHLLDDSVMSFRTFVQKCEHSCTWFWQDVMLSGGDVTDADGLSYASESNAAILMLIFQYVSNGGTKIKVSLCWGSKSNFVHTLLLLPDRGVEYCDEHVCLCVCVCLSPIISSELRGQYSPNFLCLLPVAVARSSSGGVVVCYVFPVLWMTSYLHISWDCSMSLPGCGWGSEAYTQTQAWAWHIGIPVAGSGCSGLLLAVRAY